jgi:hypothetical protein
MGDVLYYPSRLASSNGSGPPMPPAGQTVGVPHPKRRRARSISPITTIRPEVDAFSATGRPIFEPGASRMGLLSMQINL